MVILVIDDDTKTTSLFRSLVDAMHQAGFLVALGHHVHLERN